MAESADYREKYGHHKHKESVLYYALANLTIKAWEAHAAALQHDVLIPRFVSQLRQKLLLRKAQNPKHNDGAPLTEKPMDLDMLPPDQFGGQFAYFDPNSTMLNQTLSQQPMFPSMDASIPDWSLWNGMMQGMTPMVRNDWDEKMPFVFP